MSFCRALRGHERNRPIHRHCRRKKGLRSPAPCRRQAVSDLFGAGHAGRQRRARDQLLDDIRKISFPGAGRIRGHFPLGAVSVVFGARRGTSRPVRSAPHHPDRHGAVHGCLGRLGRAVLDRHTGNVACHRDLERAWAGRRVLGTGGTNAGARYCRAETIAQRRAPVGNFAHPWAIAGASGGRRRNDHPRPGGRCIFERGYIFAAYHMAVEGAVRR